MYVVSLDTGLLWYIKDCWASTKRQHPREIQRFNQDIRLLWYINDCWASTKIQHPHDIQRFNQEIRSRYADSFLNLKSPGSVWNAVRYPVFGSGYLVNPWSLIQICCLRPVKCQSNIKLMQWWNCVD